MRHISFFLIVLIAAANFAAAEQAASDPPNIVVILADDMGYGDVHALNPKSQIATPNIDRLAKEGVTFTDGHSPAAVCTPTRYALLTGRYCWRSRLKSGVLGGYSEPLLEPGRPTVAQALKNRGYRTGAVGKWHLGMALPMKDEAEGDTTRWDGDPGVDFAGLIKDSPIHHGFDYYFGVSASLDMAPYVYIRNDRFTAVPTNQQERVPFPHFVRQGPRAEDFVIDQVLDRLTQEAVGFIAEGAKKDAPFFLYFPMTAPHKPTQPHSRFQGRTGLNEYGDFVAQVDWTVGQVLKALDDSGAAENTLVVYTSDNGSYMHRYGDDRKDHVDDARIQGYRASHHRANGPFRGAKADIYEAGHHVPLFVRWPGHVKAGSKCEQTVCQTDLYATLAEVSGAKVQEGAAEDSCSLAPMLRGESAARPVPVVHHSAAGMFAIRDGKWKLILGNGSGGRERPRGKPFEKPYQLYDMSNDVAETTNLADEHPDIVKRLTEQFNGIRN